MFLLHNDESEFLKIKQSALISYPISRILNPKPYYAQI